MIILQIEVDDRPLRIGAKRIRHFFVTVRDQVSA